MDINKVERVQESIKLEIKKALAQEHYQKAIELTDTYCDFTQLFNNIMRDDEIEDYLKTISHKCYPTFIKRGKNGDKRIIFYDQIGTTICLGLQYIRALYDLGYEIIYIFECWCSDINHTLLNIIKPLCKEVHIFNSRGNLYNGEGEFLGVAIQKVISESKADKLILHPSACGALGQTVLYSLNGIEIFRIIPGDHHFYIGYDFVSHFLEFRKFGISNALYNRHINRNLIYRLPYYPIIDEVSDFKGFPEAAIGKTVFMAAGGTYKFMGSNLFLKFVDWILENNKNAFVFVGEPPKSFVQYSKHSPFKDRFFILGYRKDFVQCVQRSDVLIGSYPFGGGLVCQTAAYFSKPILVYRKPEELDDYIIEDLMGDNGDDLSITDTDLNAFKVHIDLLGNSKEAREKEGANANMLLQTRENFTDLLGMILRGSATTIKENYKQIENKFRINKYLKIQNNFRASFFIPLLTRFGFRIFTLFPFLWKEILRNPREVSKFLIYHYVFDIVRKK